MLIEDLKQSLIHLDLVFSGVSLKNIFLYYGYTYLEVISFLIFLIITIESFIRYKKITINISPKNSSGHIKNLVKVVEKRKLFLLFYCSFIIVRISYILFRFTFTIIYYQKKTFGDDLDLGFGQEMFHNFILRHTISIVIEGIFLALAIAAYGILSYRIKQIVNRTASTNYINGVRPSLKSVKG